MSPVAYTSSHTPHLPFPTFLSVFNSSGMSLAHPRILPMRKRPRCITPTPSESRTPAPKKYRSQSYPQSTIPIKRPNFVFLQPGVQGRQTVIARPRAPIRSLRKAAILNRARRRGWTVPSPNLPESRLENMNLEDVRGEADDLVARRIQVSNRAPRPSPLGLSNYEELDQWHGYTEEYDENAPGGLYAKDEEDGDEVYSDFNFLDTASTGSIEDEDEYDDAFSVLPTDLSTPRRTSEHSNTSDRKAATGCSPNICMAHNSGKLCC